jgi:aminoglycoside phosphotransferase family enzyme
VDYPLLIGEILRRNGLHSLRRAQNASYRRRARACGSRKAISQIETMPFKEINPISEPHRPNHVRLKQTHSSYVLLAGPYAYKIKKPVNFGFLDFSTLEKRRHFSEREVVLNRRLCPEVHLGVVPISLHVDTLAFGPGDEIVEHAIKMRRLEDRYFMLRF